MSSEASYRSSQWLLALWIVLPLVLAFVSVVNWNLQQPAWVPALVAGTLLLPLLLLGRLVIELRDGSLCWHYGFVGWPRWQLHLDDIAEVKQARGPALHAGIRLAGRQSSFTASLGSPAVEFRCRDDRRVLLGSPEPQRLASFVRARLPTVR